MQGLSVSGKGTQLLTLDDLKLIETPPPTPTWTPVAHYDLAKSIRIIGRDLIGLPIHSERYGVARAGSQMFGLITFQAEYNEMGLCVGFRNSIDKSMSVGIAIGNNVFVCSNLMMTGDITVMKKHSANLLASLEETTINTLYRAKYTYNSLIKDAELMRSIPLKDGQASALAGHLYWNGIISPRQLPLVKQQWINPSYPAFEPRTVFSFYNACTESLKSSPPSDIMSRHIELHREVIGQTEVWR